jgi:hypothetical protein
MTVYEFTDFEDCEWEGTTPHHRILLYPSFKAGYFWMAAFPHIGTRGEGYDEPIPRRDILWRLQEIGVYLPVLGYAKWSARYDTRGRHYPNDPFLPREEKQLESSSSKRGSSSAVAIAGPVVYFIKAKRSGLIKIGKANNPISRLKTMQTGSADRLTLLGYIPGSHAEESALHKRFASLRQSGEWFKPGDELLGVIESEAIKVAAVGGGK